MLDHPNPQPLSTDERLQTILNKLYSRAAQRAQEARQAEAQQTKEKPADQAGSLKEIRGDQQLSPSLES